MRAKIFVILTICIALILVACTGTREIPVIPDQELSGELLVALSYYYDIAHKKSREPKDPTDRTSYLPIHNKILRFMDKYPNVIIKVLDVQWETDYYLGDRLMTPPKFIDNMPDIIELTPHQVRWMMDNELQELSFYHENYPLENRWSEAYSYLYELAMVEGGHYMLPVTSDPMIVFYSAPTFELLGIAPPEADWTWDDFFSIARHVKDTGYINGVFRTTPSLLLGPHITIDNIEHFIVAHGGRYMSPDQTVFTGYLDSDLTRYAFEMYLDVFDSLFESDDYWHAKILSPPGTLLPTFGMGRASQLFSILDVIEPFETDPTNNRGYELLPMPLTDDGRALNTTLVTGLSITQQSQHKELAWEFMKFIVNDEDDGEPMRLVTENTLVTAEGRFFTRRPERYDNLIELMRVETLNSMASSMHFVPHIISSSIYDETENLDHYKRYWGLDKELSLQGQLESIRNALEEMKDEMIEHGIRVPWWGEYGLTN